MANAAMAMDAPLAHIRQRLDALVYDDHSQYLLGSLQHTDALFLSSHSISGLPLTRQQQAPSTTTTGSSSTAAAIATLALATPGNSSMMGRMSGGAMGVTIQRRRIPGGGGRWAKAVGITPYYVLFVAFIGLGWLFQALGVFTFAFDYQTIVHKESVGHVPIDNVKQSYITLCWFFLAEMAGAVGFGSCADHYGRRSVLLATIAMWFVGEALITAAWNYASLLTFRLIAGLGLGGQSALLITISLEFSPKRTRGRILVLSQLLGGVGLVLAALLAKLLTPWRWIFVVLAIASIGFVVLYVLYLRESPKYLASIGRIEQALQIVQGMESAHGIDRQARVTVPSSLYAPPSTLQQQQRRTRNSSRASSRITDIRPLAGSPTQLAYQLKEDEEMHSDDLAPLPLPATRRPTNETNNRNSYVVPSSGNVGRPRASTDRHAAASPAMVSFSVSSSKRFGVLFQSHYLRKTVFLWAVWLLLCGAFGAVTTCIMRRLERVEHAAASEYAFIGCMTLPGLVLSAVLIERYGRKVALAVLLFCTSVMMFIVGGCMAKGALRGALLITLSLLCLFMAGAFAALCVYTGEHYALMVRAMGIAWALACGHLGSFIGVYTTLTSWTGDSGYAGHQKVLWVAGGFGFMLLFIVLGFGGETKGLDIDIIEPLKPEPVVKREVAVRADELDGGTNTQGHHHYDHDGGDLDDKHNQRHHRTFERHVAAHEQLSTIPSSPGASFSSASSSSASSSSTNFFGDHKKKTKNWKKQIRAFAAAATSAAPIRKSTTTSASLRKKSTRSTLHLDDGDLDQLDVIVMDGEAKAAQYLRRQHRSSTTGSGAVLLDFPQNRKCTVHSDASEPAVMDWRPSDPSSDDEHEYPSHPHHHGLHHDDDHVMFDGDNRSDSEADKFSIDHYDSFRSLSTPMLEGSPVLGFER